MNLKEKEKFIDLRSNGFSFDSIAKEMKISKNTLLKYASELNSDIANATYEKTQLLIEKYKLSKINKLEVLSKQLRKIQDTIDTKDYSDLSIKELFNVLKDLKQEFKQETENIVYHTGEIIETDELEDWGLTTKTEKTLKL